MIATLDSIIRELGWETKKESEKNYIENPTTRELITMMLCTKQMKLSDFS